ncbi:hypothetical protein ACFLXC_06165, partial [Chloroflexota bacterium]
MFFKSYLESRICNLRFSGGTSFIVSPKSKTLTSPDGATLVDIKSAIKKRDALIWEDLRDFVSGNK